MADLYEKVCEKLQENHCVQTLSKAFGELKTDRERVKFVMDLDVVDQIVDIQPCCSVKSSQSSNDLRIEGNQLYKNKKFNMSLDKYNQSVLKAPFDEHRTISLAYANRSAVLFHMKEYELCLQDIQAALDARYPQEITYKILDRRGRCYKALKRSKDAVDAFTNALEFLDLSELEYKDKSKWRKDVETKLSHCSGCNDTVHNVNNCPGPPQLKTTNDKYIATSKAFDITVSSTKGRYPVAADSIEIGDVLVVEKPFASVLLQECQETHCHHCMKRIIAPFPCKECSTVRYCSPQCSTDSWVLYHSIECKYLPHIYKAGKYGHLALRALLKAGLVNCLNQESNTDIGDIKTLNGAGLYDPSDYTTIYNLVGHNDLRTVGDLFRRAVIAVFLLKCIEKTEFFMVEADRSNSLVTATGIILKHLQSFPCNAHEVSELQLSHKSVQTSVTMEIGAGIYATMSLFNHSCEPNVTRFFYGDVCVVRALSSIPAGHEIADNYGVLSALTPKSERQSRLSNQYFFHCNCQACENDFPLFEAIAHIQQPTYRCDFCGFNLPVSQATQILCPKCNVNQDIGFKIKLLERSEQRLQEAISKLFQGHVSDSLPLIQSHLKILEKNVIPPWKGFNSCKELIKQAYNMLANVNIIN